MLQIDVHPEVYDEIEHAWSWYENQAKGLGRKFLDEVNHAVNSIRQFPNTWPTYSEGTRRIILHRFPFALIYRHNRNKVQILALMHLRRKPGYWKNRD